MISKKFTRNVPWRDVARLLESWWIGRGTIPSFWSVQAVSIGLVCSTPFGPVVVSMAWSVPSVRPARYARPVRSVVVSIAYPIVEAFTVLDPDQKGARYVTYVFAERLTFIHRKSFWSNIDHNRVVRMRQWRIAHYRERRYWWTFRTLLAYVLSYDK